MREDNPNGPLGRSEGEDAGLKTPGGETARRRGVKGSLWLAFLLLAWDVALSGSFAFSFLVCPIWLPVTILKSAMRRPGWRLALPRIAIPLLTLGLVLANDAIQRGIAEASALRVIAACEGFHAANGTYPMTLDELVPMHMPSVPRAKYCLAFGEFRYWNLGGHPLLVWYVVPPFGRMIYDFEDQTWSFVQ